MILTLITLGKMLEAHSKGKTTNALKSLMKLSPKTAVVLKDGEGVTGPYMTDNLYTECAYYPGSKKLVVINNSGEPQTASVETESGTQTVTMEPYETVFVNL